MPLHLAVWYSYAAAVQQINAVNAFGPMSNAPAAVTVRSGPNLSQMAGSNVLIFP